MRLIQGIYVSKSTAIIMLRMNGHTALEMDSRVMPPIPQPTKRQTPSGGVTIPMARFTTIMIPKWRGSTPICVTTGRRTGTRMMMEATVSMKVPIKSRRRLMSVRMTTGFVEIERIASATACGTRCAVRIQLNTDEVAMMNMIVAVPIEVFTRISFSFDSVSSR